MKSLKKSGFTLVELMIFFVFMSLMLAAAAPMITKKVKDLPRRFNHGMYMCYRDSSGNLQQKYYNSTRELTAESGIVTQCTFAPPKKAGLFKVELYGAGAGGYTYHHWEDAEPPRTGQYNPNGGYSGDAPEPTDDDIRRAYNGKTIDAFVFEGNGGDAGVISFTYFHPGNSYCTGQPSCTPYPAEPTPPSYPRVWEPSEPYMPQPPYGMPTDPGEDASEEEKLTYQQELERWMNNYYNEYSYERYLDALERYYEDEYPAYIEELEAYNQAMQDYQDALDEYYSDWQYWYNSNSCSSESYRTGEVNYQIKSTFGTDSYGARKTITEDDKDTIDRICASYGVGSYQETASSSSSSLQGGSHAGGRGSTLTYNFGISIPTDQVAHDYLADAYKRIQVGSCEKTGCGTFVQNVFPKDGLKGSDCTGVDMTHGGILPPDATPDENGKTQYDGKDIDRIAAIKPYEGELIQGNFITGAKAGSAEASTGVIYEYRATPGEPTSGTVLPNDNGVYAPTLYVTAQTNDRTWSAGNGGGAGAVLKANVAQLSGTCVFAVPNGGGPISDMNTTADSDLLTTIMSCNDGKFVLSASGGSSPSPTFSSRTFDAYAHGGGTFNFDGTSGGASKYKAANPFNKYERPNRPFGQGGSPSSVSDPCTDWYGSIEQTILSDNYGYTISRNCNPDDSAVLNNAGSGVGGAVFISW